MTEFRIRNSESRSQEPGAGRKTNGKRPGYLAFVLGLLATGYWLLATAVGPAYGLDPRHNAPISCDNCHVSHSSLGSGMTNAKENATLCLSCHTSTGMAGKKPFVDNMKATPGVLGISHAWDVPVVNVARGTSYPTNPELFLRLDPILKGRAVETSVDKKSVKNLALEVQKADSEIVDKVIQFYAFAVLAGGAASGGSASSVSDSSKSWAVNDYVKYYVRMSSGANKGKARAIASNTGDTLALLEPFSSAVAAGDGYELLGPSYANSGVIRKVTARTKTEIEGDPRVTITAIEFEEFPETPKAGEKFAIMGSDAKFGCSVCHNQHLQKSEPWTSTGPYVEYRNNPNDDPAIAANNAKASNNRKFLRIDTDRSQLCLECHNARATSTAMNTRVWHTGEKKSHPIWKVFANDAAKGLVPDVTTPAQFNSAPLEPDKTAQTGTDKRYGSNSSSDANLTNNLVLDPDGRIACLSCHGMHYTDSKGSTEDKP